MIRKYVVKHTFKPGCSKGAIGTLEEPASQHKKKKKDLHQTNPSPGYVYINTREEPTVWLWWAPSAGSLVFEHAHT